MDTGTPPGRDLDWRKRAGGSRCSYGLLVLGGAICRESDDPATAAKRDTSTRERFERRIEVVLLGPLGPMGDPTWTTASGVFGGGFDQDFGDCHGESR